ncbi:MAG: hypothetical protein ACRCX2_13935 [Paraclostridium sp.]
MLKDLRRSYKWKRMNESDRTILILAFKGSMSAERAMDAMNEYMHINTYYNMRKLYFSGREQI